MDVLIWTGVSVSRLLLEDSCLLGALLWWDLGLSEETTMLSSLGVQEAKESRNDQATSLGKR